MFTTSPLTRYLPGECGSVMAFARRSSGRSFSHAHCAFPTKKRCSGVRPVSYTHLDVYKRQPTGKPDRTPFWENFRFADNPPGTPRTGQSRLNECFGLKSPVELKKRSLGSSVADSGFSNRPRTGAASDRELHVSNTRQKGSTDMRLEKRLHIYSS